MKQFAIHGPMTLEDISDAIDWDRDSNYTVLNRFEAFKILGKNTDEKYYLLGNPPNEE